MQSSRRVAHLGLGAAIILFITCFALIATGALHAQTEQVSGQPATPAAYVAPAVSR